MACFKGSAMFYLLRNRFRAMQFLISFFPHLQVDLSEDTEFIVLACDGIWYVLCAWIFYRPLLTFIVKVDSVLFST